MLSLFKLKQFTPVFQVYELRDFIDFGQNMEEIEKKIDASRINPFISDKNDFSMKVEEEAMKMGITCFDFLLKMIEEDLIGLDTIQGLISPRLLQKLELDATSLNLLKKPKQTKTLIG